MTRFMVPSTGFVPHHIDADTPEEAIKLGKKLDAAASAEGGDATAGGPGEPGPIIQVDLGQAVGDIIAEVGSDKTQAQLVLDAELAGKARTTLITAMTAVLEA